MNLEDLIEARLAGQLTHLVGPADDEEQLRLAIAGHEALLHAVGETSAWDELGRRPPCLPDDYELLEELGRGGMGVVYRARQKALGREVAVKVLSAPLVGRAELVQRFLKEARHMAQVRHPHVVAVHEVGEAQGEPFFAMDLVQGGPLSAKLADGPLTPTQAVTILVQVGEAIHHAHEQGIIHRDLKPANVLLDNQGRAMVSDFGLAREVDGPSNLTSPGQLLGTPAYMAPEQARGDSALIGEATDIHALGALLYEMLTARPPYGNDAPADVFARLLKDPPLPPRHLNAQVPFDLETICLKALAKTPGERYASARAMVEDLKRCQAGEPIHARRPGPLALLGRFLLGQWRLLLTALITAVVVTGVALYLADSSLTNLRGWGRERETQGDFSGAIEVYQRALKQASGTVRDEVREDLVRCIRQVSDPRVALGAARPLLEEMPEVSFGPHDFLIAQSVISELKARHSGRSLSEASLEERDLLELAQKRLQLFLRGGQGLEEERQAARESLAAVVGVLSGEKSEPTPLPRQEEGPFGLPTGTLGELRHLAADASQHPWERGKAAYASALRLDNPHRGRHALDAFEFLRSAYPMYEGVAKSTVIAPLKDDRMGEEAPECVLLRKAHTLVRELVPGQPHVLGGGVEFRIQGVILPPEVAANVQLRLNARGVAARDQRFLPFRTVPFQKQRARVGVADGTYDLILEGAQWAYPARHAKTARLLELDLDRVPKALTVKGEYVEVVVPARKLEELHLRGPAVGAAFDPRTEFLHWEEVKGAAWYRVLLNLEQDRKDARTIMHLPEVKCKGPRICLGTLEDAQAANRMKKLLSGRIATWAVEAFDAEGRRIALSLDPQRPFLVASKKNSP